MASIKDDIGYYLFVAILALLMCLCLSNEPRESKASLETAENNASATNRFCESDAENDVEYVEGNENNDNDWFDTWYYLNNPANPISPTSPLNPISPLNPFNW